MTKNNAEHFTEILQTNESARQALGELVSGFTGDRSDDRTVYQEILSPVAERYGVDLSYDDTLGMGPQGRQLTDEELDAVAGGAGMTLYQRLIAGVLTGVMVVGAVPAMPMTAFADEIQSGEGAEQIDGGSEAENSGGVAIPNGGNHIGNYVPKSTSSSPSAGWATNESQQVAKDVTIVTKTLSDVGKLFVGIGASSVNPSLIFAGADGLMGDLLNIMGMGGSTGPTVADVMDELKDIEGRLGSMDQKMTKIKQGVDIANARTLIRSTNNLSSYCDSVENMFSDTNLARLGIEPCPDGASEEERNAWLDKAVAAVKQADEDCKPGFIDYADDMDKIRELFTNVANAAKESTVTNPIGAWDDYWENYYNWETEAWTPKQALRTATATEISRGYAQLCVYYGMYNKDNKNADPAITKLWANSLQNINEMDAGVSPEQLFMKLTRDNKYPQRIYSYSLQRYATGFISPAYACNYNATGVAVQDDSVNEYLSRLHGMSVAEDLILAGLVEPGYTPLDITRGIAFQGEKSGGNWWVRTINWNGTYNSVRASYGESPIPGNEFVDLMLEV